MTRTVSCWPSSRRAALATALAAALLASLLATAAAHDAGAATILDKSVEIAIRPDGSVREHTALRVRLDAAGDLAEWSSYAVLLDENRTLVSADGYVLQPDGKRDKVGRHDRDSGAAGEWGILHSSARYQELDFSNLRVGSVLAVDTVVEERPYFPAGRLALRQRDAVEALRVDVSGGGAGWRWHLDGPRDGLTVTEAAGRVTITAAALPRLDPLDYTPDAAVVPVLHYGWGNDASWAAIGRWAADLIKPLARATPAVRARARAAVAGLDDPRDRLEALTGFVQREVRYVAVEVGIGGYRPSPPEEVLTRKWGDCKDKALLLVDLLAEAGIAARPALLLSSTDGRIDRDFPSPFDFNHMIVAVPEAAVAARDGDATAGGYLFVDPTQSRGGARWLYPGDQGQDALVVTDDGGELVRTPTLPEGERRSLTVNLRVAATGDAAGGAGLLVRGALADSLLSGSERQPEVWMEEQARRIFARLLPGLTVSRASWKQMDGEAPSLSLSAAVTLPALIQGAAPRLSFQLPGLTASPEPGPLAGRTVAAVVPAQAMDATWVLNLPSACRLAETDDPALDNDAGTFQQTAEGDGARLTVVRRAEVRRRWYEPAELPALAEVALAEHRAHRRRLRVDCAPPAAGG
jgi:transglutaminase-like putative cysteine protease